MVKNLKNLRMRAGISQQQLAEIIGTSQQSINKYENHNIEPDIQMLSALADFFGTTIDLLVGHTPCLEPLKEIDFTKEEISLIYSYRKLSKEEKDSILFVIKNYLNSQAK